MPSKDFADRPHHKLVLFDVDGTLSLARQVSLYSDPHVDRLISVHNSGCQTGNDRSAARFAKEVCRRLRWRLGFREDRGTIKDGRCQRWVVARICFNDVIFIESSSHRWLWLCICWERIDGLEAWKAAPICILYWFSGRGTLQALRQFLSTLYCGPWSPHQTVCTASMAVHSKTEG